MNAKQLFGIAGLAAFLAPGAFAQPPEDGRPGAPEPHMMILRQLDANDDGQITRDEFDKGDLFSLLDKNSDGVLSPEDHPGGPFRRGPEHLLRLADEDRDGTVNAAEWSAFLAAVDLNGKGVVDPEIVHQLAQERFGKGREGEKGREEGTFKRRGPHGSEDGAGPPALKIETLNEMFKKLDTNADGTLQADELPGPPQGMRRRHHD